MSEERPDTRTHYRFTALLGIFFGLGFVLGFLSGYIYLQSQERVQIVEVLQMPVTSSDKSETAADETTQEADSDRMTTPSMETGDRAEEPQQVESELSLDGDYLGEDENGFFIGGVIINRSGHAFDAVRITFDLCDSAGEAFYQVWDNVAERMEPGDSWGFTIYIPYAEMSNFDAYRLHSIMGVTR